MFTKYTVLSANINKRIRNHLMDVDALPPTMALAELANELTEIVFTEMSEVGLTREKIDNPTGAHRGAKAATSAA